MRLFIQIPCYNEAGSLPITLAELPRVVEGFDEVHWLVIDDGSDDGTAEVARRHGVDHVVRHTSNRGLAAAFTTGLEACLDRGADVIVNTDADNQYNARDIVKLVQPILEERADLVIGARPIAVIEHFGPIKKMLQRLGSYVVRMTSGTNVTDAPSGFRAFTRAAAQQLVVFSKYTYTLETIIQAGRKNLTIANVGVRVNRDLRPSRLFKSIFTYVRRSVATILRIAIIYQPARFFGLLSCALLCAGTLIGGRFVYFYALGQGDGKVQSLILTAILIGAGFQSLLVAVLADVIAANRRLLEDIRSRQFKILDRQTTEPSIERAFKYGTFREQERLKLAKDQQCELV